MRRNAAGVPLETMMSVRGSRALLATPVAPPCLARRLAAGAAAVMVTPVLPTASVFDPTVRGVVRQTFGFVASSTASLSAVLVVLLFMFYGSSWDPRRYYRRVCGFGAGGLAQLTSRERRCVTDHTPQKRQVLGGRL